MQWLDFRSFRLQRVMRWMIALAVSTVVLWPDTGLRRVTPTNVRMPLVPGIATTTGYTVEREAFPGLVFDNPVAIVSAPGEPNRLYIVERAGRIVLIPDLNNPSREVFLDISSRVNSDYTNTETGAEGLTCVAFHPNHAQNGFLYVVYTCPSPSGNLNRLSRFTKSSQNRADPNSEFIMIDQPDTGYGHNFNDVKFGPDGYLYVAVGDEGDGRSTGDEYGNSQRIDKDFFSAIMRIDVDTNRLNASANSHPSLKGGYKIPADNPFVNATHFNGVALDPQKVRTEFWAVGFRNPWRLFFDQDGTLYAGDVGLHAREEINIVRKGGNYGWAFREGASTGGALGNPPAGVELIPPVLEYPHGSGDSAGRCVIGGVVYRGSRLPDLQGAYIFADYVSGNIWSLRHNGSSATEWKKIVGMFDVSAFGIDPRNGDVLVCKDKINGPGGDGIYRLEGILGPGGSPVPPTLAETGLFADVRSLTPAAGFVPYTVNAPLWSDGAEKTRWFGMLNESAKIGFSREGRWTFPEATIWIKHFELELEKGNPASRRRIETRVLVKNSSSAGLYGVTYRWGTSLDNATLVPDEGATETFQIKDGSTTRAQTWRFPSRTDCLTCHTAGGGYALGFNTAQLNRDFRYPLSRTNQVIALRDAGYLDGPLEDVHTLRRLADLTETNWSREYRVRSYLAANCANCHNASGVERARWNADIFTPLPQAGIINGELLDFFGSAENRVVKPGDPSRSVLLTRMKQLGQGHMPPLGSSVVHDAAVGLIEDWIRDDLANYKTFEEWAAGFDIPNRERAADPDGDGASNYLEYLVGTNPGQPGDGFRISVSRQDGRGTVTFPHKANRGFEVSGSARIGAGWRTIDTPANAPFFPATNRTGAVDFLIDSAQDAFYRVRVYEP
jgi:uncharacterized repeat protein (TIGR03806 family)